MRELAFAKDVDTIATMVSYSMQTGTLLSISAIDTNTQTRLVCLLTAS